MPDWFWFVVSPLVLIGYLYYTWKQKRQTKDTYRTAANRLGWKYTESDEGLANYHSGPPFEWGRWKKAEHVFRGKYRGRSVIVFEFSSRLEEFDKAGDERSKRDHYQIVSIKLNSPKSSFDVETRGFASKVARHSGLANAGTGDTAFDNRFTVESEDNEYVSSVLTEEVRQWLLRDKRADDNPIRVLGDEIVTWRFGMLDLQDVEDRVEFLCDLLERTPRLAT
ncbi:hypothetical protein [Prauserella alba]|uniref:Uncharacterized protein n=1 Tax=Prauserella alba TaxID=176898 RepID=A0ABP4G5Z3_9PSEU|nr:hypothetical protein [Prauserella alba]MCP2182024.1 hypothetical protein [Prauserella alba]